MICILGFMLYLSSCMLNTILFIISLDTNKQVHVVDLIEVGKTAKLTTNLFHHGHIPL